MRNMGVTEAYKVFGRMKDQTVISDWLNMLNVGTHNRHKTDARLKLSIS